MGVRIAKYIADCGVASRRDAEKIIESGVVTVNGVVINTPVFFVDDDDVVNVSHYANTSSITARASLSRTRFLALRMS